MKIKQWFDTNTYKWLFKMDSCISVCFLRRGPTLLYLYDVKNNRWVRASSWYNLTYQIVLIQTNIYLSESLVFPKTSYFMIIWKFWIKSLEKFYIFNVGLNPFIWKTLRNIFLHLFLQISLYLLFFASIVFNEKVIKIMSLLRKVFY